MVHNVTDAKNLNAKLEPSCLIISTELASQGVKKQAVEMVINSSGIRNTEHVLNISKSTIISLKTKENSLIQVNPEDSIAIGSRSEDASFFRCNHPASA